MVFSAMCQQGLTSTPRSFSAKCILLLTFFSLFFLYSSYSANIVALLQAPSYKIKTLEDLYNSKMELAIHDTIYTRYFAPRQTEKIRKLIYEKRILKPKGPPNFLQIEQGIAQMRRGLFAFLVESGPGYKMVLDTFDEHEKCDIQQIEYLQILPPYYAIQKNSTYQDLVRVGLNRLVEHGLTHRENSKIYSAKPKCSGNTASFMPVSIIDVQPAFFLMCWGFGIAALLFVLELFARKITVVGEICG